jgi:hypothetical protein
MHHSRPLAKDNGRLRPPLDCRAPYGLCQYVILHARQVLLDFAGSVQEFDPVGTAALQECHSNGILRPDRC